MPARLPACLPAYPPACLPSLPPCPSLPSPALPCPSLPFPALPCPSLPLPPLPFLACPCLPSLAAQTSECRFALRPKPGHRQCRRAVRSAAAASWPAGDAIVKKAIARATMRERECDRSRSATRCDAMRRDAARCAGSAKNYESALRACARRKE